ncbi:MAG: ABC transporter permease [Leptospiraceae bacterium]|nr:ABC transporter permease [Leptospiraceae bacterium]MDW8305713.1 ABC transporter permease [Leptospiraceae bacterium]
MKSWLLLRLAKKSPLAFFLICLLIFLAIFADFIASPLPYLVWANHTEHDIPLSPLFAELTQGRTSSLPYRRLAAEGKIKALFAPIPFSPYETNLDEVLAPPKLARFAHYMGTDNLGRDVAARLIHGTRNSILVGFVAVALALILGLIMGSLAGYLGGFADIFISRFIEVVICFPTLILILAVLSLLKPSLLNIMIVIGATGWTGIARVIRGEFLKRKHADFVLASRLMGASHLRLILKHILPNSLPPVIVISAFGIAGAVLTESALSFLGIGVPAPEPSWGDVLKLSQDYPDIAWWLTIFPGCFIFLTVVAFNRLGDTLREELNPRETFKDS